ncbi:hypothetical protein APA24_21575 [Pseudomonas aeruginosa]|uniref:hypothetical protein n=1 Tax=Pseudomonas aeruginosa TaxID=287 RepID=UPI00071B28B0|nr:hypothetical protein [Pseudomonas aeruginosa]KSJ98315.1 hypothetical protein APA24_21575 [Pseudomonas aeruginosa]
MGIAPDSILGVAVETVTDKINDLDTLARNYSAQLSEALAAIGNITVADVPAPTRPEAPIASPPPVNLDEQPTYNPSPLVKPEAPGGLNIDDLLADLDVGDMDDLPDAPTMIPINIPDAPSMKDIPVPERPDIDTTVEIPDAPQIAMPDMEALEQIRLPEFVFPELPTFDATPPDASGITVPNVFINWLEPVYQSEVLDELQAKIKELMAGGTGLPAPIEQALFARARERDSGETTRAVQEAVDTWAARNFSMPPGMLARQVDVVREQGRLKAAELNRDILVQAATWEIENLRFAVQQGLALEQLTENMHQNMAQRLFEVARFHAESQINVFNAQISLFNAQNAAFETLAQVYRTKLDAAISKLTAYKTAVEGQVALGQINQQRVEVFKAKLDAVQSSVEVYKALMQGASVRAETIKNQFDAYRADVQAYAEQIGAEKVKFDAYEARVKGESAKADVLDAQARAYASTIQGLANKADVKVKGAQIKMEAARTKVSKFLADVDAYKAALQANLSEVQYNTSVFQAQVEAWRAAASANVADAEMQSRFADMNSRTNIAYAEMQISEYTAKMQNAVQQAQIALEAAKALGQYTAQLAAGALSAAHVSASISGSGSASSSESKSESTSTSYNYNY